MTTKPMSQLYETPAIPELFQGTQTDGPSPWLWKIQGRTGVSAMEMLWAKPGYFLKP